MFERGMPVAVISSPLLAIGKDLIGFVHLLKPDLSLLVARIAVRVVFHGRLAEGRFEFSVRAPPGDAEHLIIIPSRHLAPFSKRQSGWSCPAYRAGRRPVPGTGSPSKFSAKPKAGRHPSEERAVCERPSFCAKTFGRSHNQSKNRVRRPHAKRDLLRIQEDPFEVPGHKAGLARSLQIRRTSSYRPGRLL